jgi:glycosyltransferase involved in cell wall biosynthesis
MSSRTPPAAELGRLTRVSFIINEMGGGGAERAVALLAGYLAGQGVAVQVITVQESVDAYQLDPRIQRRTLRSGRLSRGAGKVLGLPVQAAELARALRGWRPDVAVSFLPRSNIVHVMTRWFGNRNPVLVTEQAFSSERYRTGQLQDRVMRWLIRTFYPRADAVLPSSLGVQGGLRPFGVEPERMRVVYNPIDVGEIQRSAQEPVEGFNGDGVPTIITVGRHVEQKDHHTLLRAFAEVRRRTAVRLVLLGQGPLRPELEGLAAELGIQDSVLFAGWQSNPFAWLARSDLFVLSSRFEGFGNVLVEAMACGLPVVSTDCCSGPREILRDGEDGLLVPVGDVDALAGAMLRVLQDRPLRERLARRSLERASDFDISIIGAEYQEVLTSLAER